MAVVQHCGCKPPLNDTEEEEEEDFLDAAKDAFPSDFVQTDCRYTLYAVVVHSGSAHFGHYTAYVRARTDRRWYHADDSRVQQASWEDVQGAYGDQHRSGFGSVDKA